MGQNKPATIDNPAESNSVIPEGCNDNDID